MSKYSEACAAKAACDFIAILQTQARNKFTVKKLLAETEEDKRFLNQVESFVDTSLEHSTDGLYELFIYDDSDKGCDK